MFSHASRPPELVPRLSRGKHRNPRQGACFMELASYLAGERWSDHPACTHPLLATLARLVNDHTTDAGRDRLLDLVPSVIGLTSDDPHVDVRVALRSATTALPVAAAERQRVLAVAVLAAERVQDRLDGRRPGTLSEPSRAALEQAPDAAEWARAFTQGMRTTAKGFHRHAAPSTVHHAVVGIAQACVPDPDGILRGLLAGAIADCRPAELAAGTGENRGIVPQEPPAAAEAAAGSAQAAVVAGLASAPSGRSRSSGPG